MRRSAGLGGFGGGGGMPRLGGGGSPGGGFSMPGLPGMGGQRPRTVRPLGPSGVPPTMGGPQTFGQWNQRQMVVAKLIVGEAVRMGLPPKAAMIALATAMQESGLRVLANPAVPISMQMAHDGVGTDHDSVGPFQQRQSWGTTADLMNPATSAHKFYEKLMRIPGWQSLPVTVAAQKVQSSAYPSAYAKHEGAASNLAIAILSA